MMKMLIGVTAESSWSTPDIRRCPARRLRDGARGHRVYQSVACWCDTHGADEFVVLPRAGFRGQRGRSGLRHRSGYGGGLDHQPAFGGVELRFRRLEKTWHSCLDFLRSLPPFVGAENTAGKVIIRMHRLRPAGGSDSEDGSCGALPDRRFRSSSRTCIQSRMELSQLFCQTGSASRRSSRGHFFSS